MSGAPQLLIYDGTKLTDLNKITWDSEPVGTQYVYYRNLAVTQPVSNGDGTYNGGSLLPAIAAIPSGKTLVLPPHTTWTDDFVAGSTNAAWICNRSLEGWLGHRDDTILKVNTASWVDTTGIASGTGISYYSLRVQTAAGLTFKHFKIDAGSPDVSHLNCGFRLAGADNSTIVQDVLVSGVTGNGNTPPNETAYYNITGYTGGWFIDCIAEGGGIGGSGFQSNTSSGWSNSVAHQYTVHYVRCIARNMRGSHGFAMWRYDGIAFEDCQSYNNGTGTGSSAGDGFNLEEGSINSVISMTKVTTGCIATGNTLCAVRWENGDLGGVAMPATSFTIDGATFTTSPVGIRTESLQNVYPTVTNTTNSCTTPLAHVA